MPLKQCSQCLRVLSEFPCSHCKEYQKLHSDIPFDKKKKKKRKKTKTQKKFGSIDAYRKDQIGEMRKEVNSMRKSDQARWERETGRSIV